MVPDSGTWNIRKCGASGNGSTPDTGIIQETIDRCHRQGGGRVLIPPGVYLTGSLLLKSAVELHLARGATLMGSPHIDDYLPGYTSSYMDRVPEGYPGNIVKAHLLAAKSSERISITGQGTIDGNGPAFFGEANQASSLKRFSIIESRPWHMVAFYDCEDVLMEGVHLLNTTTFSVCPHNCKRLRFEGLTVKNHPSTPNGDGIDIDCCRDVIIEDCFMDTADDCIAIKSGCLSNPSENRRDMPCENISVSSCVLKTRTTAVRLGVEGDNPIRNVNLNNLCIEGRRGIGLESCVLPSLGILNGTPIENVQVSQVTINNAVTPVYGVCGSDTSPEAGIGRLSIHQMQATSNGASIFYGKRGRPIDSLFMRDVYLKIKGAFNREPFPGEIPPNLHYPGGGAKDRVPYALYGRYLKNVILDGVTVDMEEASGPWAGPFRFDDTENATNENITVKKEKMHVK